MSAAFRDESWEERFKAMGDESEGRFVAWCEQRKLGYARYGLDRPPIQIHKLPARVRYTPDFLMSGRLVECQGFGRDQTVKLKLDKWGVLHWWNDVVPTWLFLWDSHHQRHTFIDVPTFDAVLGASGADLRTFPEGKAYFAIGADHLFAAGVPAP